MLDFAVFKLTKKVDEKLEPLPIYRDSVPEAPFASALVGYPGGIVRAGEEVVRATLVKSDGVTFRNGSTSPQAIEDNGGKFEDAPSTLILTEHIRSGNSGSPILVQVDGKWVVVGIAAQGQPAQAHRVIADSQKSAAKDRLSSFGKGLPISSLHSRTQKESFWLNASYVKDPFSFTTDLSKKIASATYEKSFLDGEEALLFTLNFTDTINLDHLFINGKPWKYSAGQSLEGNSIKVPIYIDEIYSSFYPELILEFSDTNSFAFGACYRDSYDLTNRKVECYGRFDNEFHHRQTKANTER
jgi:hypothetical protein